MSSFIGSDLYSVDAKGRINIPAKMRKNLAPEANGTFIVTRGVERCVYAYPLDEWRVLENSLRSLNQFTEKDRLFTRTMLEWADETELDNQSRITMPRRLLEFAMIAKEALVIGVMDRIEMWNPEVKSEYDKRQTDSYEQIAEHVMRIRNGV